MNGLQERTENRALASDVTVSCVISYRLIWLALIHFVPSCAWGRGWLHHMNASSRNMKTVLVLLLAALLGLSEAKYRRTVSYEGEVVVKWYVSSDIGDGCMQTRATLILFNSLPAALAATGRDCGHY